MVPTAHTNQTGGENGDADERGWWRGGEREMCPHCGVRKDLTGGPVSIPRHFPTSPSAKSRGRLEDLGFCSLRDGKTLHNSPRRWRGHCSPSSGPCCYPVPKHDCQLVTMARHGEGRRVPGEMGVRGALLCWVRALSVDIS